MHSSPFLFAAEFPVTRESGAGGRSSLAEAFPDYHSQDRVAVVARTWERAFIENAAGVLGLTALFYDAQRATGKPFYTYPSHYLLLCQGEEGLETFAGRRRLTAAAAGYPWGNVDLWPETQWLEVADSTSALLRVLFAQHIHRLLWPEDLAVEPGPEKLPGYMRLILASRLKSVHYYDTRSPDVRIEASPAARRLLQDSPRHFRSDFPPPAESRYRSVAPALFMSRLEGCFEPMPAPEPHERSRELARS